MKDRTGATVRSRTADILITSEVLYQLSYGGPKKGFKYNVFFIPCPSFFSVSPSLIIVGMMRGLIRPETRYFNCKNPPPNLNIVNKDRGFWCTLATSKILDVSKLSLRNPALERGRLGETTEAYEQYAAGRSDRRQRSPSALLRAVSDST